MSALRLSHYAWADPRRAGEGLRVSCTRYLPRGVRKEDYARRDYLDVWLPLVAPSRELLAWVKQRDMEQQSVWSEFSRRYKREMARPEARQTIWLLAAFAGRTPLSIGCSCQSRHCHRFLLAAMIGAVGA